jgi:RNA polymerase sigma factor (sigma-70 family)
MTDNDWLAARFEQHRTHLRQVAHRLLGSANAAEDAVQEAWLRLDRADTDTVTNLRGWLTTVVSRIALDMLRASARRPDTVPSGADVAAGIAADVEQDGVDPASEAELADAVGAALMVVLDRLTPTERLAFVLHDTFAVPFDEIGYVLDRSSAAAKQLASRARAKVRGAQQTGGVDPARQHHVLEAFLDAARNGDFTGLLAVLDPDIVLEADGPATRMGAPATTRGAHAVATMFSGRALGAEVTTIDGHAGLAWTVNGTTKVAWNFYIGDDGRIVHIDMHADRNTITSLAVGSIG